MGDDTKNVTELNWQALFEQESEENARLHERIADLERSAASAREIARVAMTHTGTQAVRVEMCVRAGQFSLIICDPRGAEQENALGARVVELLQAAGMRFSNVGQIGSSD